MGRDIDVNEGTCVLVYFDFDGLYFADLVVVDLVLGLLGGVCEWNACVDEGDESTTIFVWSVFAYSGVVAKGWSF